MDRFKSCLTKHLAGVVVLFHLCIAYVSAQSKAHELSKFAIIDPAYSSNEILPESEINDKGTSWIYGASELECWCLQILQQQKDSAKLNVGYPGVFHKSYTTGSFRLKLTNPIRKETISFSAVGHGKLYINDLFIASFPEGDSSHTITLKKHMKISLIQFDIDTRYEPIALLMDNGELSTSLNTWDWKPKDGDWEPAFHFPQNYLKLPPHKLEDPTIVLKPERVKDNLYDFGKELYGYLMMRSNDRPKISVGESEKEALDVYNKIREQSAELINTTDGVWKSKYPLAFRYLFTENRQLSDISCQAIFSPASYKGAFACSDTVLTQIWMSSAYTLRLCMHDFFLTV